MTYGTSCLWYQRVGGSHARSFESPSFSYARAVVKTLDRGAPNPRISSPPQSLVLLVPLWLSRGGAGPEVEEAGREVPGCRCLARLAPRALQIEAVAGGASN
jgi:hypothetical protein